MKLKIYFKTSNNKGFEIASYQEHYETIVAQWLSLGRTLESSSFFLVLYDDDGKCVDAKYLSKNNFSRLLIEWDRFGLKESND
ncbi:hypothetical protein P3719_24130 [Vibrio parahaemolyticus]|uniref:hypothetical protein n=1 Tax=Vibrio parahaemolyticus TaxID=670 RepID=UPI00146BF18D|nr:hypothetical protein [Vibrio parahaemolyticus]MDF5484275.1 hypothetical protein [Vibrio parahaemolyticus]MDF5585959.1 hypothetical protein [Vibrio parahaemolyticus]MDF5622347.1 hypothetical protein [Vibrio parahaemolyticus]MDF5627176.1 hypothetical protein [Vibrio parahaemolyticus]MDF5701485.1 hypothetical protein [Vibrio parahaemolyticus]